jgi:type II secretory pathway pseudopilin PulG
MTAAENPTSTGKAMSARIASGARERGFTYLGLIILLAVIGLAGAASLKIGSLLQRAAAEQELLDIGAAFSDALQSYAAATPPNQPQQPASLQELLKDPRFPFVRRHLRKLFVDPITGKAEWGIVHLGGGETGPVLGVYSLSQAQPLKIGNFDARFQGFDGRRHLSEWKFMANGQGAQPKPASAPAQAGASLFDPAPVAPPESAPQTPAGAPEPPVQAEPAAAPAPEPPPEPETPPVPPEPPPAQDEAAASQVGR